MIDQYKYGEFNPEIFAHTPVILSRPIPQQMFYLF